MDIILIPGFWLDGSAWDEVVPALRTAGHRVHALTLPGLESAESDRSKITLRDHVDAVVSVIDSVPPTDKVVLVGHSGGGAIAHAAVDARPERVSRVVYVDSGPLGDGVAVNDQLPTQDGEVPLPDWSVFEEQDLVGLDDELRAAFRERAIPTPVHVATDRQQLGDERRYDVPVTVVACSFSSAQLREMADQGHPYVQELTRVRDVAYVDLPTGHWPQFTRPEDLGQVLLAVVGPPTTNVDEHGRPEPPLDVDETATLLGFLDYQRATLAWKCRGLDAVGLRASVGASLMTLGGMLKHLALVEDGWFSRSLHEHDRRSPWDTVDWEADPDWDWTSAAEDTPEQLLALWQEAVARSRTFTAEALADGGLGRRARRTWPDGRAPSLRWILVHMIEEYARHNGHADLIRESLDGLTGE